jgi:hypothetical protein
VSQRDVRTGGYVVVGVYGSVGGGGSRVSFRTRRLDRAKNNSDKQKASEQHGTLNRRPQDVSHPLFENSEFFDPSDLLQVKYVWLANCCFAYDSSGFPVLIPNKARR